MTIRVEKGFSYYFIKDAKGEIKIEKNKQIPFVNNIGFSTYRIAEKKLLKLKIEQKGTLIVVSYYNLLHPMCLLIYNDSENKLQNIYLGTFGKGTSEVFLSGIKRAKIYFNKQYERESTIDLISDYSESIVFSNTPNGFMFHSVFICDSFCWIWRILFIVYMIIPLLLIIYFTLKKNSANLISLLYFIEFFFLADTNIFFQRLFNFNVQLVFKFFVFFIFSGFILGIYLFLKNIKNKKLDYSTMLIIIFFILLPFALRF